LGFVYLGTNKCLIATSRCGAGYIYPLGGIDTTLVV
jgi:hypothetical protein